MLDLSARLVEMEKILLGTLLKKDKIISALRTLSGMYLDELTPSVRKIIESNLVSINVILMRYPIKTFEDYSKIRERHLKKILTLIEAMCQELRAEVSVVFMPSCNLPSLH
jgi:hypothetical protein